MKEAAMFYENFFKVLGNTMYESVPSYSPDTTPGNYLIADESMDVARNATIDFAIAKELLKNLIEGSEAVNANKPDVLKWRDMLTRIPNYSVASDNTVNEYMDSRFHDNPNAPSTSVYYPCYPGTEYYELSPELKKAFENTAKKKFVTSHTACTAQDLLKYANIFSRVGDGEGALEVLTNAVRTMAMGNLIFASTDWRGMGGGKVDTWASYTLEPNMGITSAIQEMLVQSSGDTIKLLPAINSSLNKGNIEGFLTRAGVEIVSLSWDMRKGYVTAKLKARKAAKINVQLPKGAKRHKQINKEQFDQENALLTGLELPSGKVITLDVKL